MEDFQRKHDKIHYTEGVDLSEEEQKYLLPHFTMLIVGKPGSGKSTIIKQLMNNPRMYNKKFDKILVVSPNWAKMGFNVKKEDATTKFDLDWIFTQIDQCNVHQKSRVLKGHKQKHDLAKGPLTKYSQRAIDSQMASNYENRLLSTQILAGNM